MKKIWFLVSGIILICMACQQDSVHSIPKSAFISVNGREIITPDGKPLLLRGVNLGFWLEPEGYPFGFDGRFAIREFYDIIANLIGPDDAKKFWQKYQDNFITRADIAYIRQLGLNSVRIPFDYRIFADEFFLGSHQPRGFQLMDSVLSWCRQEGVYAILDMHCAPGGQAGWTTDDGYLYPWLFEDNGEESRQQTIEIWTAIARRYANNTNLIGYDLLGEPIHQYFDTTRFNKRLEPFYKRLCAEIRKVDKNHIFFLAGAFWNRNFDVFGPPFDSKLVYTTHLYSFSHAYTSLDYYENFSQKYDVPIWVGEFGELSPSFVDSVRSGCEARNFGWCLWPLKKMNNDHCLLQIKKPENWDKLTEFTNKLYPDRESQVMAYPGYPLARDALNTFLENCRFENCIKSSFYLDVLKLKAVD